MHLLHVCSEACTKHDLPRLHRDNPFSMHLQRHERVGRHESQLQTYRVLTVIVNGLGDNHARQASHPSEERFKNSCGETC